MNPAHATFAEHRRAFLEQLRERDAAAVVFTSREAVRNNDAHYRFRPHSDFYYLTGFREPGAALVLLPGRDEGESVLFLRDTNPAEEVWTGRRLGVARAEEELGVDEALDIDELWTELPNLLAGRTKIVHGLGHDDERDRRMLSTIEGLRARARGPMRAPLEWIDPLAILHELRLHKSPGELERMREAARISGLAHEAAMERARPGSSERELDALLDFTFRERGGTGSAYTNIVASGANACILHYEENDAPLVDGELCLIDAGCEFDFYASDVTRTFPINGTFSPEQRDLYQVVLSAQKAAVDAVRPGRTIPEIHELAAAELSRGLIELGLLGGSLEEVLESKAYRAFYLHGTSHWLGLDVHDAGSYQRDGRPRPLEAGMVLTVEPGLYVAPGNPDVDARWHGIGIRIEDDVLVTPEGHENLTASIPKEVEDVESACGQGLAEAT